MRHRESHGEGWMRVLLAWVAGAVGAAIAAVAIGRVAVGFGPLEAAAMLLVGLGSGVAARLITRRNHVTVGLACVLWTLLGILFARSMIAHQTANGLAEDLTLETNVVFDQVAADRGFPGELQARIDEAGGIASVTDDVYDRAWLHIRDELRAMPPEARRQRIAAAMKAPEAAASTADLLVSSPVLAKPAWVWGGVVWMTFLNLAWYDWLAVALALTLAYRIGAGHPHGWAYRRTPSRGFGRENCSFQDKT